MELCDRCMALPVSFHCNICTSYKNLCTRCDKIIHNISSKQNHYRTWVKQADSYPNNYRKNNISDYNQISNSKNRSDLNTNQEVIQDLPINSEIENYKINNDYQISDLRNSDIFDSNSNNNNDNYNHLFRSNSTYFPSNLALIKDKNEKEYIDEMKKKFQREKELLEFRNKSLLSNLDKVKSDFSEQIYNLTKKLEESQNSDNITIKSLKNNYESKINELNEIHNDEVNTLSQIINQLKNELSIIKDNYKNKINELNEKDEIISELKNENQRMYDQLNKNKEEYNNSYDYMRNQYEKEFGEERKKIINEYENKIGKIVNNVENSKNNLLNKVEQRENDLQKILEEKNKEINNLIEMNQDMKQELESHKINLVNVKSDKDYLAKENQKLKKEIHSLDCDSQLQSNEILRIQEQYKLLWDENDKLKIELNKLDSIIYCNNNC